MVDLPRYPEELVPIVSGFGKLYAGWGPETSIQEMRAQWDAFVGEIPLPAHTLDVELGGVKCRWVRDEDAKGNCVIVYLHGGGYQSGSLQSHHNVMAALSKASGHRVLGVDYRLAPEHRFPAPLEDAENVLKALLSDGVPAGQIALCGDSAGAGLAIALAVALREGRSPFPAAIAAMSPWVDLELRAPAYTSGQVADPLVSLAMMKLMAKTYLTKSGDPRDPRASPLNADLAGLPPLLIHVGEHEVLADEANWLNEAANKVGVQSMLKIWPGMIHLFHLFPDRLSAASDAIQEIASFLNNHLESPSSESRS